LKNAARQSTAKIKVSFSAQKIHFMWHNIINEEEGNLKTDGEGFKQ
jgi:hypothetical protein